MLALALLVGVVGLAMGRFAHTATPDGCRILWVTDGDTVRAWCPDGGVTPVRLKGYDTPEVTSPGCVSEWIDGTIATGALLWHALRAGESSLTVDGRDRYDRALGRLVLDGRDIAGTMIAEGHARPYDGGPRGSWCEG